MATARVSGASPIIDHHTTTDHRHSVQSTPQEHQPLSPTDRDPQERPKRYPDTQYHTQLLKRRRLSLSKTRESFDDDERLSKSREKVAHWLESDYQTVQRPDHAMQTFQEQFMRAKRSSLLGQKRSSGSLMNDTEVTGNSTTSATNFYRTAQAEIALRNCGSFLKDHAEGISDTSRRNCQILLSTPQQPPEGTLLTDELFPMVYQLVKGKNEATVTRFMTPHLVPSARIRAIRGASHLHFLNETIDAMWIHAVRCCERRPKPDYALGINREAFSPEQLCKLEPYFPSQLDDESFFTATFDVCFPFLTTEVKCGAIGLDVADRQNALSQTVSLRALVTLFRLVGREAELHRKVLGFSISHDSDSVRIYCHYPYITGSTQTFHRCTITSISITPSMESDRNMVPSTFVQNVHDIWAPEHFKLICSAVDALPTDSDHTIISQTIQTPGPEASRTNESPEAQGSQATGTGAHLSGLAELSLTPEASTAVGRKKMRADE